MTQAEDKLKLGLERLLKAGNDADLLGIALLSIHGALEDHFRNILAANPKIPSSERQNIQNTNQTNWKTLIELMQKYGGLSNSDRNYIMDMNGLRIPVGHGKPFTGTRKDVESYASYVQRWVSVYASTYVGASNQKVQQANNNNSSRSSTNSIKKSNYNFWILPQWVIGNIGGTLLGFIVSVIFALIVSKKIPPSKTIFIVYCLIFACIGIGQQIIIRKLFWRLSSRWSIATTAGYLVFSIALVNIYPALLSEKWIADLKLMAPFQIIIIWLILGLVMGLCIGFLQWLIIKQYTIKANWWLLASAMQWATCFLVLTNYIIIPNLKMNINLGLLDGFQILLVSLIISASITGTALVWLFPADRWH